MTDWLFITTSISVIAIIISCVLVFYRVSKKKPTLLKPAQMKTSDIDDPTTYNWNLILTIIGSCVAFGTGIFILANVAVFIAFGIWYIDSRAVGVLAVVFGIYMFKEFDKFVTKLTK